MTELKVIELVEMKQNNNTGEFEIELREEFKWFLTEEFQKLREGFTPEDNSEYLKSKEKLPPTESNFSISSDDNDHYDQLKNNDKEQEKIEESEGIPREPNILKCPWCDIETIPIDMEVRLLDKRKSEINSFKMNTLDMGERAER